MFLCWRPLATLHDKFTEKMWKTDILIWCKSVIFVSSTYMCWSQMVICFVWRHVTTLIMYLTAFRIQT